MVFRHISKDIKEWVMVLLEGGWIPENAAEVFGVSEWSIYQWQRNLEMHSSVVPPRNPSQGRPRLLNADMTHDLSTLMAEAPKMFLDEIQDWLALTHDVNISKPTLHENIHDCSLTYKMLHKAAGAVK
ncbi:hypothetical protein CPB84DRAFT_1681954 [Gymnopilus junonius]|uniref:Uncharacterized protein n=1 Tax=Gymnopilus junonius TaxID=109634 RepID=A0A9P5NLY7_GYMJU|nr:hypothetical protein CPB84DRAFT_1681954 [Gymnopilus junonius]